MARARNPNRDRALEITESMMGKLQTGRSRQSWERMKRSLPFGKAAISGRMLYNNQRKVVQQKSAAASPATKTRSATAAPGRREIRMQLRRESLRLSFLIAWIRRSGAWRTLCRRTKSSCSSRRSAS